MKTLRKKDTQYKIKEILHSGSCGVRGTEVTVETENSIYVFERMWKNGELL